MTQFLWLGVFPLWQRGSYAHITGDKWIGMLVLTALAVLFRGEEQIGRIKNGERLLPLHERDVKQHIPQLLCALYFFWVVLSALFGASNDQRNRNGQLAVLIGAVRYEGLLTQMCYFLIFLCAGAEHSPKRSVAGCASAVLLLYAGVVFAQYAGKNPFGLYPDGLSVRTDPAFQGTIGNIDLASGYVVLVTGFLSALFVEEREGAWLYYAGAVAGMVLSVCMGVRSGLLSLFAGAAFLLCRMAGHPECRFRGWLVLASAAFCVFLRSLVSIPWMDGTPAFGLVPFGKRQFVLLAAVFMLAAPALTRRLCPGRPVMKGRIRLVSVAVLLVLLLALVLVPFSEEDGTLWEAHQILRGEGEDSFGAWRIGVWRLTVRLASRHLLFGTGPDTFWFVFNPAWAEYEARLYQNGFTENAGEWLERFDNPHNEFLAILSNNGLPALVFYLAFLASLFRSAFSSGQAQSLRRSAAAGVLLYVIQGMFSFSNCLVTPVFWAMAGLAARSEKTTSGVKSGSENPDFDGR